jgi:dTDP-glucose 4,6-dehydratase
MRVTERIAKVKLLVTGGAGFIGSHFVDLALEKLGSDSEVIVLDKLTYAGSMENLTKAGSDSRFTFIRGDITDSKIVDFATHGVTHIVNFAAESHVDNSIESSSEFISTNIVGVQVLLDATLKKKEIQKFLQVSTDEVYGSLESGSAREDSPLLPNSPYAASKAAADLIVRSYHVTHGLDVNISRCSNNYGSRQYPEKIIPLFIYLLNEQKKVTVYGDGLNVRDWLHVSDHCNAIWKILNYGVSGEVYNIGGGLELSNLELTYQILNCLGLSHEGRIEFVRDRKGHDFRYSINYDKISRELGYSPSSKFEIVFPDSLTLEQMDELKKIL